VHTRLGQRGGFGIEDVTVPEVECVCTGPEQFQGVPWRTDRLEDAVGSSLIGNGHADADEGRGLLSRMLAGQEAEEGYDKWRYLG